MIDYVKFISTFLFPQKVFFELDVVACDPALTRLTGRGGGLQVPVRMGYTVRPCLKQQQNLKKKKIFPIQTANEC